MRQIESRDRGTKRDFCPEMPGFVVPRDFSSGTVPQIFVPVPTVPWLWVPVPVPIMGICGTGPGSRHGPGTTAHPWLELSIAHSAIFHTIFSTFSAALVSNKSSYLFDEKSLITDFKFLFKVFIFLKVRCVIKWTHLVLIKSDHPIRDDNQQDINV